MSSQAQQSWSRRSYLDFDVEVARAGSSRFEVSVRSPAGEGREQVDFAVEEISYAKTRVEDRVQWLGSLLFERFLCGEALRRYDVCRERALAENKALRMRIHAADGALITLPWEGLYDARSDAHLALSHTTPIVRYVDLPASIPSPELSGPMRVLGAIAAPHDLPPLDVDKERELVERALAKRIRERSLELEWLAPATWRRIQERLRAGPWHVLHFIGHGTYLGRAGEGAIALSHEDTGAADWLTAARLADLLAAFRLVVLNSCEGTTTSSDRPFASCAAALVRRGVPFVLAMQARISDGAAIEFARTLYGASADGLPLEAALVDARQAIRNASPSFTDEWLTPVLFTRAVHGYLLPPPKARDDASFRAVLVRDGEQARRHQRNYAEARGLPAQKIVGDLRFLLVPPATPAGADPYPPLLDAGAPAHFYISERALSGAELKREGSEFAEPAALTDLADVQRILRVLGRVRSTELRLPTPAEWMHAAALGLIRVDAEALEIGAEAGEFYALSTAVLPGPFSCTPLHAARKVRQEWRVRPICTALEAFR